MFVRLFQVETGSKAVASVVAESIMEEIFFLSAKMINRNIINIENNLILFGI